MRISYQQIRANCSISHNGYTVQINIASEAKPCTLSVHGETYILRQFHFHTPSEHIVDARQFSMEMHLVHTNERADIAVMALLFKLGKGSAFLSQFLDQMPRKQTTEATPLKTPLSFGCLFGGSDDVDEMFEYQGSLTTPPYTEGVRWMVVKTLQEVSEKQLNAMSACWGHRNNARETQKGHGRVVSVRSECVKNSCIHIDE